MAVARAPTTADHTHAATMLGGSDQPTGSPVRGRVGCAPVCVSDVPPCVCRVCVPRHPPHPRHRLRMPNCDRIVCDGGVLCCACRTQASLVVPHLEQLLPLLYGQTAIREDMVRTVDLGPFKHKVSAGERGVRRRCRRRHIQHSEI